MGSYNDDRISNTILSIPQKVMRNRALDICMWDFAYIVDICTWHSWYIEGLDIRCIGVIIVGDDSWCLFPSPILFAVVPCTATFAQ